MSNAFAIQVGIIQNKIKKLHRKAQADDGQVINHLRERTKYNNTPRDQYISKNSVL